MKITILNGNPNSKNTRFDFFIKSLISLLEKNNHEVCLFTIRDNNIGYCKGCFGCWVKTPGRCVFVDDTDSICREYINSDLVIFSSPVIMGFTSALLKKVQDKLIPLLYPYFERIGKEFHHPGRYVNFPEIALILQRNNYADEQMIRVLYDIYKRIAFKFKTELKFVKFTTDPVTEIVNEIANY